MAATILESRAAFKERAQLLGLTDEELKRLTDKKWDSFGNFAFAIGWQPGQQDEAPLMRLAAMVTGRGAG